METQEECHTIEHIGVYVGKMDLEKNPLVCQPTVSVNLVDSKTEQLIASANIENCSLHMFQQNRLHLPVTNAITISHSFASISDASNPHYLLFFEVTDTVQQSASSLFRAKTNVSDPMKVRIAWAFLKPVAPNGEHNLKKELRLQLYKVGKKCRSAASHHTCPIYHLYSAHKRKKYAGSIYILIQGVVPSKSNLSTERNSNPSFPAMPSEPTPAVSAPPPQIVATEWSRLPTQSCKFPNCRYADFSVARRGCSALSFSLTGTLLACGSFGRIIIMSVLQRSELSRLTGHSGLIYELSWADDDSLLLSVSADCSAMIWNMQPISKTPIYVLPHPSFVYCGKWLPRAKQIITGGKDKRLRFWGKNESGFELLDEFGGHDGFVSAIETFGDNLLCSGDSLGALTIWNLAEGQWRAVRKVTLSETSSSVIDAIKAHPGGRRLVVTARSRGSFMVDMTTSAVLHSYVAGNSNSRNVPCLSPCGSLFLAFGDQNNVFGWDFETGRLLVSYSSILPDDGQGELSGVISYHPWDHIAAFAVLGDSYPIVLLNFSPHKNDSERIGLVHHVYEQPSYSEQETCTKMADTVDLLPMRNVPKESSTEEKLAAIVRNIDRALAAKRQMQIRITGSGGLARNQSLTQD